MTAFSFLQGIVGNWTGTSRLWRSWLPPEQLLSDSGSTARAAAAGELGFLSFEYDWEVDGTVQRGLLLVGPGSGPDDEGARGRATAAWYDTWHTQREFMTFKGGLESGALHLLGSYKAPPGPDWGWRIVISPEGDGASTSMITIKMMNISPDGQEEPAFENRYSRIGG